MARQPGVAANVPDFNFDRYFQLAHVSQLTQQTERDVKILVAQQHPNDRENTLAKFIGIGFWGYQHEVTWKAIYRSQLLALTELNAAGGILPLPAARAHYEQASQDYPEKYANYAFEQWLGFMQSYPLLIRHPSDMLEITLRGRDFLTFLAHWGWNVDGRIY